MITVTIQDRKLREALARAAKDYPGVALDAMARAMNGLRKDFMPDLAQRMPGLASNRAKNHVWKVHVWRSGRGNVVGKFLPKTTRMARNLAVLEYGGTIRPKDQDALAIPGPGAKDSRGRVRKAFAGGPTGWQLGGRRRSTVFRPGRGGKAFLFKREAKGRVGALLWTLVKSVTIRPRLGLKAFWAKATTQQAFFDRIRKNLLRDLGQVFGRRLSGRRAA